MSDAARAVARSRLATIAGQLRRLLDERMAAASPAERRSVQAHIKQRERLRAEHDRMAEHIRRVVAAWPPLTQEQREKIALLLLSARDDDWDDVRRGTGP